MLPSQLAQAWSMIHSRPQIIPSHREKIANLFAFHRAKQNAPYTTSVGKRHAKGVAKACGQVLKHSHVRNQVHVETVFKRFK